MWHSFFRYFFFIAILCVQASCSKSTVPTPATSINSPSPNITTSRSKLSKEQENVLFCQSDKNKGLSSDVVALLGKPVADWVQPLCFPNAQYLGPNVNKETEPIVWARQTRDQKAKIFLLPAFLFASKSPALSPYPKFTAVSQRELIGPLRKNAEGILATALDGKKVPFDTAWQVDWGTSENFVYNTFFYARNNKPFMMIVCINQCKFSFNVEILYGKEIDKAVAEGRLLKGGNENDKN
ncbi:MAG: hypothetical protein ACK5O9_02885 [Holosporales bacterium]|jgi:hypothetical protein